jgi:DNA-binding GntR family transcriptional regulator
VAFDRQRSVPKQVYELLREKILTVELKPGESINERWLAEWLGVSRTPIREAIQKLSAAGLIRTIPNVGTSVSLIDARKASELCLIRASLETAAIRVAAERFDDAVGRALEQTIEWQKETILQSDLNRNIAVDNEFHRTIVESAGFTTTWSILQNVMSEIMRVRHLSVRVPRRLDEPVQEHIQILAALRLRDPDRAEHAMRHHLSESYKSIMQAIAAHPDYVGKAEPGPAVETNLGPAGMRRRGLPGRSI